MRLHNLITVTIHSNKIVGRGIGSGRGKTAGRGTKGQKARGNVPVGFIGGTLPLYKKLPFRRGLGNSKRSPKASAVYLSKLNVFEKGAVVDLNSLITHKLVKESDVKKFGVKVVGNGELKKTLTVQLPTTISAAKKIEKAGGKVVRV
ncbi:MAG: 50S ribosomal protein L15 [Patescibacteria group bacterium]|nr:50S ribosomal protein L15 [Patescibacteria group bacterium]